MSSDNSGSSLTTTTVTRKVEARRVVPAKIVIGCEQNDDDEAQRTPIENKTPSATSNAEATSSPYYVNDLKSLVSIIDTNLQYY